MKISLIKKAIVWSISLLLFDSCGEQKIDNCIWSDKKNSYVLTFFPNGYFSQVTYENYRLNNYTEGKWRVIKDSIIFYNIINNENVLLRACRHDNKIILFDKGSLINLYRKDSADLFEQLNRELLIIKDSTYVKKCTLAEKKYCFLIDKLLDEKNKSNTIPSQRDCLCIDLDRNKLLLSFIRKEEISSKITGYEYRNNHLVVYVCDKSYLIESEEGRLFYECSFDGGDFSFIDDEEYFVSYGIKRDSLIETFRTFNRK